MKKLRVTAFSTFALAGLLFGCNLNTGALLEGSPTSEREPLAEPTENGQEPHSSPTSGGDVETMSTSDLVEVIINDSKMFDILFAYSSPQQGFDATRDRFEPLSELLNRQDAGKALLARYQAMATDPSPDWSSQQVSQWRLIGFPGMELILAQVEVLGQLDVDQLCELLRSAEEKLEGKRQAQNLHERGGELATVRLMGRILQFAHWGDLDQLAADNDDLRLFLEEGGFDFPGVVDQIEAQIEMVLSDTCAEN